MAELVWCEKDLVRRANRRLAVLQHAEEVSGNVAATCRYYGIRRTVFYRWKRRYEDEGLEGLKDRSSAPLHCPTVTEPEVRGALRTRPTRGIGVRRRQKDRQDPARWGWRAHGRSEAVRGRGIGYDYVHSMVDDHHSRLAYSEILPDEKLPTRAAFLLPAARNFASYGITTIERVITDNHLSYRRSHAFTAAVAHLGARCLFIRPHCPWQNGKVERYNRTLQTEWAYRRVFTSNSQRARALALRAQDLQHSTPSQRTRRPTAHQPTTTNLMSQCT